MTVRRFQVDLETGGDPIRAVVISDLHDHEFGENNEKLAEKIKEQEPDLILMDGDMLNEDSGMQVSRWSSSAACLILLLYTILLEIMRKII